MAEQDLTSAAQQLARPSVVLKRKGQLDRFAAVWGGTPIVPAPEGPYRYWLSVDCRFIPGGLGPATGVLSVFTNEEDCVSGVVAYDSSAVLATNSGKPLFAFPTQSFPPPDAMPPEAYDEYLSVWQSNCPLYTGEAAAVLGGWHFPWPDGDWEELRRAPLVLWTIDESEPWVEVWGGPGTFNVRQRIT